MEKEAQPRAFTAPRDADAVHSVVPITAAKQRKPVYPGGETPPYRADAVLKERAFFE